jgi:serine/threonine protein phosphatase 1
MAARTLALGDIHGCLDQLDALLRSIAPTSDDRLVLLGDLVDRGPDSKGVLDRTLSMSRTHHITVVMGNHEQMMMAARASHDKYSDWLLNGGDTTLRS